MTLQIKVAIHMIHVVHANPAAAFAQLHYIYRNREMFKIAIHIHIGGEISTCDVQSEV